MTSHPVPLISVKGKPFDCGLQHGEKLRKQIRRSVDLYFDLWQGLWGARRDRVVEWCRSLIPIIGEYDADILEELRGVAKGADLSLEEIIALNARYELVWAPGVEPENWRDGCTSMAVLPQATQNGHTFLAQNWDYKPRFREMCIILEIEQENKPNIVMHTEVGMIGFKGMNSSGIGLCVNALASKRDKFEPRLPYLIMMRGILNSDSYSQALKTVADNRLAVSGNVIIAHRDGEAVDMEMTPDSVGLIHPEKGIITHSNHFLSFQDGQDFTDIMKSAIPDTVDRLCQARQFLESHTGNIDVQSLQELLRDHSGLPNAICRHVDNQCDELKQMETLCSIIMNLENKTIFLTEGQPCQSEYYKLSPPSLKKD